MFPVDSPKHKTNATSEGGFFGSPKSPKSPQATGSPRTNVWQDVFNPGRNYNMKGAVFDNVKRDSPKHESIWDQHLKSRQSSSPKKEDQ